MRSFTCACGQPVFFENTVCLACGAPTGFDPAARTMISLEPAGEGIFTRKESQAPANTAASDTPPAAPPQWKYCGNLNACGCNWLLPAASKDTLCDACRTTRTIPALTSPRSQLRWSRAEAAKRRLLFTLLDLSLWGPSSPLTPKHPLVFDMLEPALGKPVTTGHQSGLITVNLAEADDDAREQTRVSLHEPYRTLSGHFRHEVGHYFWDVLIPDTPDLAACRQHFGDETADYALSLKRHYEQGPPDNWAEQHVSAYASMHPWEDWAETWAHFLHMRDTLETANNAALSSRTPGAKHDAADFIGIEGATQANALDFTVRVERWTSVAILCNELCRSMGQLDVYPFALTAPVLKKLFFIERIVSKVSNGAS
ncbi:hypothetical protein AYO49_05790 [Verrucomicrobiaceae bacterium SCGC AG-212-N21]|nr:hypothetical protein AYO49_05790 [Verrucomicrobiaceae bacterium SCGC AG-212-N21]